MKESILLISNSSVEGSEYLANHSEPIMAFLKETKLLLFVPYGVDREEWDNYTQVTRKYFNSLGVAVLGSHQVPQDRILTDFSAIFIGGGNTFRLLDELRSQNLPHGIQTLVLSGKMLFIAAGAGANIACSTICPINDLPVTYPKNGFGGINLCPFQIYPDYIDAEQTSNILEARVDEFHKIHDIPVIGLRKGAFIRMSDDFTKTNELFLGGDNGAKFFFKGKPPIDIRYSSRVLLSNDGFTLFAITG